MKCTARSIAQAFMIVFLFAASFAAQPASSTTYFLPGSEAASGGACGSTTYKLEASFGDGVVATRAVSSNFRLDGGFNAVLDATVGGRPWLTGVMPLYGPLLGGTAHTLHGTELHLGPATNVTVGGKAATVLARTNHEVRVTLPPQPAPGWQPVTVTNAGGTDLMPRGLGVLPLLEKAHAVASGQPFRLSYRGTMGDLFFLAAAGSKFPFPIAIPPYHHGFQLNLGALLAFLGPFPVTDPSGVFHLDFPGIPIAAPIHVQLLVLPIGKPGYEPGSFTNVISL